MPHRDPAVVLSAGPVPLYHQIAEDLQQRILGGGIASGDALPTEEKLCEQYGVSRITVRRAVDDLIQAGLVRRRRGVGTFVTDRRETGRSTSLVGSLYEVLAYPPNISIEVLQHGTLAAEPRIAEGLRLTAGEPVMQLEVFSRVDSMPFASTRFYFPPDIGAGIAMADLVAGMPVARLVERHLGEPVVRATQQVEPEQADAHTARLLAIPRRTAILHVWRTYYTAAGRPVEQVSVRYHPDRYHLRVELLPGPQTPG